MKLVAGAIFWHGIDVVPYLILATFFWVAGGAYVTFWGLPAAVRALARALRQALRVVR